MELTNILATTAIPQKKFIHDCVDTGNTLSLTANQTTLFLCDCVARNYKSDNAVSLWFPEESLIKDTIDNTFILAEFNATLYGTKDTRLDFLFYIPHPQGDIYVKTKNMVVHKNNTDDPLTFTTLLYNGIDSDAKTY